MELLASADSFLQEEYLNEYDPAFRAKWSVLCALQGKKIPEVSKNN